MVSQFAFAIFFLEDILSFVCCLYSCFGTLTIRLLQASQFQGHQVESILVLELSEALFFQVSLVITGTEASEQCHIYLFRRRG